MEKHNIALCGAYDILSYGDSLFPVALEWELTKRIEIDKIFLFAPIGCDACMSNGEKVYSYDMLEELHSKYGFSAIIIGGGEMLHFDKIYFKDVQGKEIVYQEAEIWKRPIEFAKERGIRYVVNAVGAPREFEKEQQRIVRECFKDADYISVRDVYSCNRLRGIVEDVKLVPDSLWNIDRYLSKEVPVNEGEYVVLQYGTMYQNEDLFQIIDEIKRQFDLEIVILPINYCHEDKIFSQKAKNHFGDEIVIYDYQLSVEEIYNIIANAKLFIGTSLHGTLTALSNKVRAIVVDMYPSFVGKLDGMVEWMKEELPIISDVRSLMYYVQECLNQKDATLEIEVEELKKKVDNHFDVMAKIIKEGTCDE